MSRKFENIKVYTSHIGALKKRAAVTIPGIGIFVNPLDKNNIDLLRHEYGHILQAKKWGFVYFMTHIAFISLRSARKANRNKAYNHMHCWTEWSANKLAYEYFSCPKDWNFRDYPIAGGDHNSDLVL
jgi:hypothetical protein